MKYRMVLTIATVTALLSSMPALAADNVQSMLQSNGCTACHTKSQKIIGPAWGWVAYHYQGKKNAADPVTNFIIKGGVGYWKKWTGLIPMPPHPTLSKVQAKEIARWILAQPPIKPPTRN